MDSLAVLAAFLLSQNLASYFPVTENDYRPIDEEYFVFRHFPPCPLVAQLVHFFPRDEGFDAR